MTRPLFDLYSEYRVAPRLLIVHDPTAHSAFARVRANGGADAAAYLFREHPDETRFGEQHRAFVDTLRKHLEVVYLAEILGDRHDDFMDQPNLVFTRDPAITLPWEPEVFIRTRPRPQTRRAEPDLMAAALTELGLREIVIPDAEHALEGGDVMPVMLDGRKTLLVGYGPRTERESLFRLRETLVPLGLIDEIIGVELASWRLNLDGCLFPVADRLIVVNRESILGGMRFSGSGTRVMNPLAWLAESGCEFVETTRENSFGLQACNFACLGDGHFVGYGMTETVNQQLRQHGLRVESVQGDEMVRGNGGPHCMTRPVY